MKKIILIILALSVMLPVLLYAAGGSTPQAQVIQGSDPVNTNLPNIPGTKDVKTGGPAALVYNIYIMALWLGGALAFASILFAGIQYLSARGSTEAVTSAKGRLQNAILGLLLLLGMYILLGIVNPDLTRLRLPVLQKLPAPVAGQYDPNAEVYGCIATEGSKDSLATCFSTEDACDDSCESFLEDAGLDTGILDSWKCKKVKGSECNVSAGVPTGPSINATCEQHKTAHPGANSCTESPSLAKVKGCVLANVPGIPLTTTGGQHAGNSCHFGGRTCKDGGHAIDVGINGASSKNKTLPQMKATVEACGNVNSVSVTCYYETSSGSRVTSNDPNVNHIHCNVDTASCGCQ